MSTNRKVIARIQRKLGVTADGVIGRQTKAAARHYTGVEHSFTAPTKPQIRSNRSLYGKAGHVPMTKIVPPYTLYYHGKAVPHISVHSKIAPQVITALTLIKDHYGEARIKELGLDIYDGCFNFRPTRNGTSMSMHAYAVALDFDAAHNGNKTRGNKSRFTAEAYDFWWIAWIATGARPFGLFNDRDYMHIEYTSF